LKVADAFIVLAARPGLQIGRRVNYPEAPLKGKLIKLPLMIGAAAAAALLAGAPAMAATPATAAPHSVVTKAASPDTEYELFFGYYAEFQACDDEWATVATWKNRVWQGDCTFISGDGWFFNVIVRE
jgi:hypothetical protein